MISDWLCSYWIYCRISNWIVRLTQLQLPLLCTHTFVTQFDLLRQKYQVRIIFTPLHWTQGIFFSVTPLYSHSQQNKQCKNNWNPTFFIRPYIDEAVLSVCVKAEAGPLRTKHTVCLTNTKNRTYICFLKRVSITINSYNQFWTLKVFFPNFLKQTLFGIVLSEKPDKNKKSTILGFNQNYRCDLF